jgi:predicted dehydrogenase
VRLKQLLDEGALGKPVLLKQSEKHDGPHAPHFWDVNRSGGGVTMDMGCHAIEFFRWMLTPLPSPSGRGVGGEGPPPAIACVQNDKTPLVNGEDGRAVLEAIFAAYMSARTGRKEMLPFATTARTPHEAWSSR